MDPSFRNLANKNKSQKIVERKREAKQRGNSCENVANDMEKKRHFIVWLFGRINEIFKYGFH